MHIIIFLFYCKIFTSNIDTTLISRIFLVSKSRRIERLYLKTSIIRAISSKVLINNQRISTRYNAGVVPSHGGQLSNILYPARMYGHIDNAPKYHEKCYLKNIKKK